MITRKLEPDTVIETSVHRGVSALFILQALEDNGKGMLYSIDLPYASYTTDRKEITKSSLPENKMGICVQTRLRNRWKLILGNSRKELPALLEKVKNVDIFLHDSEHTFNHMMWEFETVWPYLNNNGVLISDDIEWSDAFKVFSNRVKSFTAEFCRDRQTQGMGRFGIIIKQ